MKKLKLLFPLFTTSALAIVPVLTAQSHPPYKSNVLSSQYGAHENFHRINRENNKLLFVGGKTDAYYYDSHDSVLGEYSGANLSFTFTSYGATLLAKAETLTTHSTGGMIMAFLDKNLKYFDNGTKWSYLNEIEGVAPDGLFSENPDGYAYSKFMNTMGQPASVVYKLTDMFKKGEKLPQVTVWFHYFYHEFESNTYDVLFAIPK